jgi:DNA-binding PadR family transcriptional regulator
MSPRIQQPPSIEIALLGFLRPGPRHGYSIHQEATVKTGLGLVWLLKQGSLYATLAKFEEQGLIQGSLEYQDIRPARRVFQLTDQGVKAFEEWLTTAVATPRQMRQEFMAKLYFARKEGPEMVARLVKGQKAVCTRWLEKQQAQAAALAPGAYEWLVCQYRIRQLESMLSWLCVLEPGF